MNGVLHSRLSRAGLGTLGAFLVASLGLAAPCACALMPADPPAPEPVRVCHAPAPVQPAEHAPGRPAPGENTCPACVRACLATPDPVAPAPVLALPSTPLIPVAAPPAADLLLASTRSPLVQLARHATPLARDVRGVILRI